MELKKLKLFLFQENMRLDAEKQKLDHEKSELKNLQEYSEGDPPECAVDALGNLLFDEKILFSDQGSMLAVMQKHLGAETECPASKAPWRGSFPSLPVSMADAEEESELHRCFS